MKLTYRCVSVVLVVVVIAIVVTVLVNILSALYDQNVEILSALVIYLVLGLGVCFCGIILLAAWFSLPLIASSSASWYRMRRARAYSRVPHSNV
jgi:hypothetical protein